MWGKKVSSGSQALSSRRRLAVVLSLHLNRPAPAPCPGTGASIVCVLSTSGITRLPLNTPALGKSPDAILYPGSSWTGKAHIGCPENSSPDVASPPAGVLLCTGLGLGGGSKQGHNWGHTAALSRPEDDPKVVSTISVDT